MRTTPESHACLGTISPFPLAISFVQKRSFISIIRSPGSAERGFALLFVIVVLLVLHRCDALEHTAPLPSCAGDTRAHWPTRQTRNPSHSDSVRVKQAISPSASFGFTESSPSALQDTLLGRRTITAASVTCWSSLLRCAAPCLAPLRTDR